MEYLVLVFACKLVAELVFKLAKTAYKQFKAKKKPSATTLDK